MKKLISFLSILSLFSLLSVLPVQAETYINMEAQDEALAKIAAEVMDDEVTDTENKETETRKEINFPDVKEGDWYFPFVKELFDQGLMEGYPDGKFGAWDPINRAEFAKVIVKLQDQIREPWYERHMISLILVAINVFGWILVMAALGRNKGHQDVNVNVQVPSQKQKNETPQVTTPSTQKPQNIKHDEPVTPSQEKKPVEAKNDQNNWWNK